MIPERKAGALCRSVRLNVAEPVCSPHGQGWRPRAVLCANAVNQVDILVPEVGVAAAIPPVSVGRVAACQGFAAPTVPARP